MNHFLEAIQELRSVPTSDYEERIEDICRDLADETSEEGRWPVAFISEVMNLLNDVEFLSVRTSWNLLRFVKDHWDRLSPEEVSAFREVLRTSFDRFGDWMGPFLASEMLGELYPDQETLRTLMRLSETAAFPARELVPHGLEALARSTPNETLRGLAIQQLQKLQENDSEQVRREAQISLSKLEKKKLGTNETFSDT